MEMPGKVWIAAGAIGASAVGLIATHFDTNDPLFSIGEFVSLMSFGLFVAGFFTGKRSSIDDAFEAGYQAGHHRGQRVKPKLIYLPTGRTPVPSSHRLPE